MLRRGSICSRRFWKRRGSSTARSGSRCGGTSRPCSMPEGDTLFRTARTLQTAIGGQVVTRFETVLPRLARVDEDAPLAGRTVERVESAGKWLLMRFSGDLILLTHMLMSGSWHIYRPGERWQRPRSSMRIVIETARMVAVAFD